MYSKIKKRSNKKNDAKILKGVSNNEYEISLSSLDKQESPLFREKLYTKRLTKIEKENI